MRRIALRACALIASVCAATAIDARSAAADSKSAAQAQADKLFAEGRALITSNKPAEACEKFEAAIKLDPTAAGTMLNLGACYEQLNKPKTALVWFRKTQVRASETNLPDYESAAKEHTRQLATVVPTLAIEFSTPAPDGTKVKVDSDEISATDYARIEIDPGSHDIEVRAPGKVTFHRQITAKLQEANTITVALVAGSSTVVRDPGRGRRLLGLGVAAGGGAMWVATLIYGFHERDLYKTGSQMNADDAKSDLKYYGTGMFVIGAAAVGVGAYLYFTAPDKERVEQTMLVPAVGAHDVGVALSGVF